MRYTLLVLVLLATSFSFGCQRASIVPSTQAQPVTAASPSKAVYTCAGVTKKGERCKRHVKADGDYCWMHISQDKRK